MKSLLGLNKFKSGKYSQNGEAGIINELLKRLGINSGTLIEFGANDGYYASNTMHLLESGNWKCVYIEPYEKYRELEKLNKIFKDKVLTLNIPVNTKSMNEYVMGTSLDEIIQDYCNGEVDLVSIDIDSFDYHIFKELEYNPKIVIIEINGHISPDIEYIDRQNPYIFGTSFLSMLKLGEDKGYKLVAATGNCFFVREDLCERFKLPNPYKLFDYVFINEKGECFDKSNIYIWKK